LCHGRGPRVVENALDQLRLSGASPLAWQSSPNLPGHDPPVALRLIYRMSLHGCAVVGSVDVGEHDGLFGGGVRV
jgi:hypothetical protein